ncbi:glycoprotein, partial [Streptomyces sp. PSRA5]|uniref:glycoprotein n=1 Tax=Streptomyces panacea TaxID=3035064 RepID=UPI00339CA46A
MRTNDPASIRDLLDQAEVLADTYADYDTEAARRRVNAKAGSPGPGLGPCAGSVPDSDSVPGPRSAPEVPRSAAAHEQAARDLDLAVALIVDSPQAATALARLADDDRPDPEGAVVFAALLHLTRDHDGAQFWWQFAAGGGNRTAAFCLSLAHGRRAEFSDARHWRAQARRLSAPDSAAPPPPACPLLPESIRHRLLTQCRSGDRPTLPARLEA